MINLIASVVVGVALAVLIFAALMTKPEREE
jgi:hypothetical protein